MTPPFRTHGIDHVAVSVRDQERAESWYREVLGLERVHADVWGDEPRMMMCSGSGLALFAAEEEAPRTLHIAFRVDRLAFDTARAILERRGIAVRFEDHQVSHSLYFRDPDGHRLELTTYDV